MSVGKLETRCGGTDHGTSCHRAPLLGAWGEGDLTGRESERERERRRETEAETGAGGGGGGKDMERFLAF